MILYNNERWNLTPFKKAVLAFFHAIEACKISTMKIGQYIFSIALIITLLTANNQTAEDILLQTSHRMDGINHRFKVDSKSSDKKKKEKHFQVSVYWPSEGNFLRQTRVTSINPKRKNPSSFWEHRFRNGIKTKKWMSMPITGKLKDVSKKKISNNRFSFSELDLTDEDIISRSNKLLPYEKVDTLTAYVIESKQMDKKGNIQESKKLWIDIDNYMILKVESYTRNDRLYRSFKCSNFIYLGDVLFPLNIDVQDFKSKTNIQITIREIELNPEFDMNIFIPQDQ